MNGGVKGWSTYKHKNLNSFALNERVYTLKGLISGFLLGSISLALYSIIIGVIAPKSPESFNVETFYGSQLSNSETSEPPQNISLDNFNFVTVKGVSGGFMVVKNALINLLNKIIPKILPIKLYP